MEKQISNNSTASKCFRFLFQNLLSNLPNHVFCLPVVTKVLLRSVIFVGKFTKPAFIYQKIEFDINRNDNRLLFLTGTCH
jgi:hypothetical protein